MLIVQDWGCLQRSLQFHKLGWVIFVQGICLTQVTPRIELVEPVLGGFAFFKEQDHCFDTRPGKGVRPPGPVRCRLQLSRLLLDGKWKRYPCY